MEDFGPSRMSVESGAEAFVRHLIDNDIRVCFANPGTTEMHLVDALSGIGGIHTVLALHENVATGAADGYARMKRLPAMTLLHLGPGLANGLANLHNAKRAHSPILNVVGTMASWHQSEEAPLKMDVTALAQTVSGWTEQCTSRELLDECVQSAFAYLDASVSNEVGVSRVATLLLAHDVQREFAPPSPAASSRVGTAAAAASCKAAMMPSLPAIADHLQRAGQQAAFFVGGLALCEPLLSRCAACARSAGAALLCANNFARADRGTGRPPELIRLPYFPRMAMQVLESMELVVFLDSEVPFAPFGYEDGISALLPPAATTYTIGAADIESALAVICAALPPDPSLGVSRAPSASQHSPVMSPMPPQLPLGVLTGAKMCAVVAALQPRNAIVVDESLTSGTAYWELSTHSPPFSHLALSGGAIGQGPPCAVGAAIACPHRRVINLQADGSGLFTAQALWTQARERLRVTTIVCQNDAYGILQLEMAQQRPRFGGQGAIATKLMSLDDPPIDWLSLARGYGVHAVQAHTCEDLVSALREALQADGPRLIVALLQTSSRGSNRPLSTPSMTEVKHAAESLPSGKSSPDAHCAVMVDTTLHLDPWRILEATAERLPDRMALQQQEPPMALTYHDLHAKAQALAAFFGSRGVQVGACLGALCSNHWQLMPMHFAVAALRAVLLNLNTRLAIPELAHMLSDAAPCWLAAEHSLLPLAAAAAGATQLDLRLMCLTRPDDAAADASAIKGLPSDVTDVQAFESAILEGTKLITGKEQSQVHYDATPDTGFQMYYTSGTTGFPKGVVLTARNVCTHAHHTLTEFHFNASDLWAHLAPMFHLVDAYAIFAITWAGGTHLLQPRWDAGAALRLISAHGVTATHIAATMMQMVLSSGDSDAIVEAAGSLRLFSCGGSTLPAAVSEQAFGALGRRFFTSYGMTECSGKITISMLRDSDLTFPLSHQRRCVSSQGRRFADVELRLRQMHDDDNDANSTGVATASKASHETVGEVHVRGAGIFGGYWKRPEATEKSFADGRWFITGDLGTIDDDGWLSLVGRHTEMIIFGGENVYAAEVERALCEHPRVALAAVVGVEDPSGQFGELVKAFVLLTPGAAAPSQNNLVHFCAERLARYKCPMEVEVVDEFPYTATGKVRKAALPRQLNGQRRPASDSTPGNPQHAASSAADVAAAESRWPPMLWRLGWRKYVQEKLVRAPLASSKPCLLVSCTPIGGNETSGTVETECELVIELRRLLAVDFCVSELQVLSPKAAGEVPTPSECDAAIVRNPDFAAIIIMCSQQLPDMDSSAVSWSDAPILSTFNVCRAMRANRVVTPLYVMTCGAYALSTDKHVVRPEQHALVGWLRSYARETTAPVRVIDLCPRATMAERAQQVRLSMIAAAQELPSELAFRGCDLWTPSIEAWMPAPVVSRLGACLFRSDASYVVTGGLGAVGMHVVGWMMMRGARALLLVTRSARTMKSQLAPLQALRLKYPDARVEVHVADVASRPAVFATLSMVKTQWPICDGIFHLAGTLEQSPVRDLDWSLCERVLGAKAHGAMHLHECSLELGFELRYFVLASSIYALLGYAQLAPYAAANAALDGLASHRHACGLPAIAINFGLWRDANSMAPQDAIFVRHWQDQGMDYLEPSMGLQCLETALSCSGGADTGLSSIGAFPVTDWGLFHKSVATPKSCLVSELTAAAQEAAAANCACAPTGMSSASCDLHCLDDCAAIELVLRVISDVAGHSVDMDAPLMDAGVDSLASVQLRSQLECEMDGRMPATLSTFDHPTARQLALALSTPRRQAAGTLAPNRSSYPLALRAFNASERHHLGTPAIAALSALLPNDALLQVLYCGGDCVVEVPLTRWNDTHAPASSSHASPLESRVRHGGFLHGAELVDLNAFGLSHAETHVMDPSQRVLLEHGYASLKKASFERLADGHVSLVGIFVGFTCTDDFSQVLLGASSPVASSTYAATGSAASIVSGRLSYVLGLHGPCISYDTACSASLSASHAALRALQLDECTCGLVAGVALMLTPAFSTRFAVAGMTSARGRCHTFDARADGYARGEVCGAVTLRCDEGLQAMSTRLAGSAVRQDGRSASLTAPNGRAQQWLLIAAFTDAQVTTAELALSEAHGTGTPLGDPIEAGSLNRAWRDASAWSPAQSLFCSSAKASFGHAEAGAGITGLCQVAVALRCAEAAPNAQLRTLNPLVGEQMVCGAHVLGASARCATAFVEIGGGVSSFGYGGTIAHAVLRHSVQATAIQIRLQLAPSYRRRAMPWNRRSVSHSVVAAYAKCWVPSNAFASTQVKPFNDAMLMVAKLRVTKTQAAVPVGRGSSYCDTFLLLSGSEATAPSMHAMHLLLELAQQQAVVPMLKETRRRMLVVTSQLLAQDAVAPPCNPDIACGGVWGFMRVIRLEVQSLQAQTVAASPAGAITCAAMLAGVTFPLVEDETAWDEAASSCTVARIRACGVCSLQRPHTISRGAYAITGGLGGLGRRAVALLAQRRVSRVVLTSRSSFVCARSASSLPQGTCITLVASDVGDRGDALSMWANSPWVSVLHAAGELRDKMLRSMQAVEFSAVFTSKAVGASLVHLMLLRLPLESLGLFSSVTSTFGNVGQSNYGAANAHLDAIALSRRANGHLGSSLQIPAVAGSAGMYAASCTASINANNETISLDQFAACLEASLALDTRGLAERVQTPILPASSGAMARFLQPLMSEIAPAHKSARSVAEVATLPFATSIATFLEVSFLQLLGELASSRTATMTLDTPLIEVGCDSIAAMELSVRLQALSSSRHVAPTVLFDHPTARAIVQQLLLEMEESPTQSEVLLASGESHLLSATSDRERDLTNEGYVDGFAHYPTSHLDSADYWHPDPFKSAHLHEWATSHRAIGESAELPGEVRAALVHKPMVKPNAKIRLFTLYGMGGFGLSMQDWWKHAPEWLEVRCLELPGHGWREGEPLPLSPGSPSDPTRFICVSGDSTANLELEPSFIASSFSTKSEYESFVALPLVQRKRMLESMRSCGNDDATASKAAGLANRCSQSPSRSAALMDVTIAAIAAARDAVVSALVDEILPLTGTPYAIYGFSNGALLSWLMAKELERRGAPPPARLFCAGRGAPHIMHMPAQDILNFMNMDDNQTVEWAEQTGVLAPASKRQGVRVNPRFGPVARSGVIGMVGVGKRPDADEILATDGDSCQKPTVGNKLRCKQNNGSFLAAHDARGQDYYASSPDPLRATQLVAILSNDDQMWPADRYLQPWEQVSGAGFRSVSLPGVAHHLMQAHPRVREEVYTDLASWLDESVAL